MAQKLDTYIARSTNKAPVVEKQIPKFWVKQFPPTEKIVSDLDKAFEKHGDVIQLTGLPFVRIYAFRKPEHNAQILLHPQVGGTKHPKMLPRVQWVMRQGGYILKGGTDWITKRRQVNAAFAPEYLEAYTNKITEPIEDMLKNWTKKEASGKPFDILKEMQLLITKINFQMFFSEDLSEQKLEEMSEKTFFIDSKFIGVSPLWFPLPDNLRFKKYTHDIRNFMTTLIHRRRKNPIQTQDLLSVLMELKHPSTGQSWSHDEILDEICSIYFGASVMSTTLTWGLYLIATHKEVQTKLKADNLTTLEYSRNVLKEILRFYPPALGYPRRCEEGMEIDGYKIPPHSIVVPMVYYTHHNPHVWKEPQKFDPDRFNPEELSKIHPFAHIPFGGGQRACLGANLAPMVMKKVLALVCQHYRLEYVSQSGKGPRLDIGFEIHPKERVLIKLHSL